MAAALPGFPTTRCSALLGARSDDAALRQRSWTALTAAYWKPAYKHVRVRWRKPREDAEDLTQAFFERAMERDFFARYEPERARFRTFFRVCLDRFVSNAEKARTREKRGGARALALDFDAAEAELASAGPSTPEDLFDREWKRSIFSLAIDALRAQCDRDGKSPAFRAFERYDLADPDARPTYDAIAGELGVPATTVTNHLAWARRELRRLVIEELAGVTASPGELHREAQVLLGPSLGNETPAPRGAGR